jgi:CHAT domain-containing protein/tetratricopeptide (TPR) repeat protein
MINNSPVKTERVCTHILSIFVVSIALLNAPLSMVSACDVYYNLGNPQQLAEPSLPSISAGFTADRELKPGGAHSYKLNLASGQFLHVVVEQKGIDVVVRLFAPDGKKLIEVDSPNGTQGPEPLSVIIEVSGDYRLEVASPEPKAEPGHYELNVQELRAATPKDRERIAAETAVAEATQFRAQATGESLRKAIEKLDQSLPLWRGLEDRGNEATTLSQIGEIYQMQLGETQKGLDYYGQALPLYRSVGNTIEEGRLLNNMGSAYFRLGQNQKALEFYNQSLALTRAAKDQLQEGTSLVYIGRVYARMGETQHALEYFDQGLALIRKVGYRLGEAHTLVSISNVYSALGELQKSLDYLNQALPVARVVGDRSLEGGVLNSIGYAYTKLGELEKSLEYYGDALKLLRATGNRFDEAFVLDNLGQVYNQMGEPDKALQNYSQALEIRRALADRSGQSVTLHNIGQNYFSLGELDLALQYFEESLSLKRAVGNPKEESYTLDSIGGVYFNKGELQKALDYHNQSLALRRKLSDQYGEAYSLVNIGAVYDEQGELQKALDCFDQALKIRRAIGDRYGEAMSLQKIGSTYGKLHKSDLAREYLIQGLELSRTLRYQTLESTILLSIAREDRERGNIAEAIKQVEAGLNIIESTRTKVSSQGLRSSYLASKRAFYELYVDLLMQRHRSQPSAGYDAEALQASERMRARSLLDILTESRADIRQGVEPALLERERVLQQQLSTKSERLTRLIGGKHTEEQQTAATRELQTVLTDYRDVQEQIRAKSPRYAALTQPRPLALKEIQKLLDEDTVLLEYALGEERSYLWTVSTASIKSFELPRRAEIEAAARRVYELLVSQADDLYPEALTKLSQMLLSPTADQLGSKRLLIVSEGTLQYIPFGALPVPDKASQASDRRVSRSRNLRAASNPLIKDHEIVSLPSASVLGVLRRESSERRSAPKTVAVLADPVFEKNDERVKAAINARQIEQKQEVEQDRKKLARPSDLQRSTGELGLNNFDRLVLSRREANEIAFLVPGGNLLKAVDFAASRATATGPELSQYRIVHFATHGLLNNKQPELSGIVLSLVDDQGRPQDGFLRLYEIYNLKLDADLVVLSACQTALGKEIKGEGLVGLTRGFMYAGAPRVVASLWKVNDEATSELMKRFYQKMLKEGMRPAAALRAAQVSMLTEKSLSAAYYWAGFVLQGEWK